MNTQLKNQWIALEEQCHILLKEKIAEHNQTNDHPLSRALISSQLTFCKDGVLINKRSSSESKGGISVMFNDMATSEIKAKMLALNSQKQNHSYLYSYKFEEVNHYNPKEIVEQHLNNLLNTKKG
ncbi:hypothetical protein [Brumimicrobium oceani]|uniref:Uncharacterized protein n=1 Tax=Brumimicrobium oceani TaxID=2100725 RepID=A0A2U2XF86_9FLAO|nr:hypothetical protein [Brumimicrobium oceani]PWH86400.1 hypothetical protein DIT68_03940 [Brumimicrobium oceani]